MSKLVVLHSAQLSNSPHHNPGLLILTGRPVDQPAGRPAFLSILAGQNWPKLKMFRK